MEKDDPGASAWCEETACSWGDKDCPEYERYERDGVSKEAIRKLLETPFWPEELKTREPYFRTQDDCDGDLTEGIVVTVGPDGDVWVNVHCRATQTCRFRMPFVGGGMSPRVRNALLILAVAIKLDNEEHPTGGVGKGRP
jgi:hypothetical protein